MSATEFQQRLRNVAERARAINTRDFEGKPPLALKQDLLPVLSAVLSEAIGLLGSVLTHYEKPNDSDAKEFADVETEEFYRRIDGLMNDESGPQRIVELAFIARWELKRKAEELQTVATSKDDAWDAIARCGSSRRRLLKSAIAVETAICEHEGLSSTLRELNLTELRRSLETRRAYAIFRGELSGHPGDGAERIKQGLRGAGIAIARLIGRDVYEDLRVTDRMQVRTLQERVLRWLRGDEGFDGNAGLQIWQDLSAFADLLLQVNNRQELREHDQTVLAEMYADLFALHPAPESIPVAVRRQLEPLLGRDRELDELIQNPGSRTVDEWKPTLRRLLQALATSESDFDVAEPGSRENDGAPVSSRVQ